MVATARVQYLELVYCRQERTLISDLYFLSNTKRLLHALPMSNDCLLGIVALDSAYCVLFLGDVKCHTTIPRKSQREPIESEVRGGSSGRKPRLYHAPGLHSVSLMWGPSGLNPDHTAEMTVSIMCLHHCNFNGGCIVILFLSRRRSQRASQGSN